jgi:hypothetical protein
MVGARKIQALGHIQTSQSLIIYTRIPLFQDFMFRGNMQNIQLRRSTHIRQNLVPVK